MRPRRRFVLVATLSCLAPSTGEGQSLRVDDELEAYWRVLEVSGAAHREGFALRPLSGDRRRGEALARHPWADRRSAGAVSDSADVWHLAWTESRLRVLANTGYPSGWNDGAVWQGRGLNTAFEAGGHLTWGPLRLRVQPVLTWSQNAAFDLEPVGFPGVPQYAYPFRLIDLPQRHGSDSDWTIHPGESEARLDLGPVSLGIGTRKRWWGPGIENALLMSNNAPGFPHTFLGTRTPVDIGFGTLEALWMHGGLKESAWFDPAVPQGGRFLNALVLAVTPKWPHGLSVGLTRVFYGLDAVSDGGIGRYLRVFGGLFKSSDATTSDPLADDQEDQLASLFMRWTLPRSGLEFYSEWAWNDANWDLRDFALFPEHSRAGTLGFQHVTELTGDRLLVIGAEVTDLVQGSSARLRDDPTYYQHSIVTPGYTHRGQLIGAAVGPGGASQSISGTVYSAWGRSGLTLQRRVHDQDAYFLRAEADALGPCCSDVSLLATGSALAFVGDFDVGADLTLQRELNRYFIAYNDVWNLNLVLTARWQPR